MDDIEADQLRFHPAWKAALRHVKEHVATLVPDQTRALYRFESGHSQAKHDCLDFIDQELLKSEGP